MRMKACFATGLLLAAGSGPALAASPGFCANYATAAVNQVRIARRTPPCAPGAIGARWSGDYRVHYGWCITAAPAAAADEREMRTRYLRSCRR